jgi:hypothetical protein
MWYLSIEEPDSTERQTIQLAKAPSDGVKKLVGRMHFPDKGWSATLNYEDVSILKDIDWLSFSVGCLLGVIGGGLFGLAMAKVLHLLG